MTTASTESSVKYTESLMPSVVREWYICKCRHCGVEDPYNLPSSLFEDVSSWRVDDLPDISYCDVYNHLLDKHFFTGQALKAYKELEAYKYFKTGWVFNIQMLKIVSGTKYLFMSKVAHSHSLSLSSTPWIVINKDGSVESAHCTCMAGLGEACNHIAAFLFAIEARVKTMRDLTFTSIPPQQLGGYDSSNKTAEHSEGSGPNFTGFLSKKTGCRQNGMQMKRKMRSRDIPDLTPEKRKQFYKEIKETGIKSAILTLIPRCADLTANSTRGAGEYLFPSNISRTASSSS